MLMGFKVTATEISGKLKQSLDPLITVDNSKAFNDQQLMSFSCVV